MPKYRRAKQDYHFAYSAFSQIVLVRIPRIQRPGHDYYITTWLFTALAGSGSAVMFSRLPEWCGTHQSRPGDCELAPDMTRSECFRAGNLTGVRALGKQVVSFSVDASELRVPERVTFHADTLLILIN